MDSFNAALEELGHPVVTQEEHEDISGTFTALEDPESLADTILSAGPAEKNEQKAEENVFYVNFQNTPDTPQLKKEFDSIKPNVDLSIMFFNNKANAMVESKIKDGLLKEPTAQANFKAKCINAVAAACPWVPTFSSQVLKKSFTVKKKIFHETLVSTFTEGLGLPKDINTKFEGLLNNMRNTIGVADKAQTDCTFFILLTFYVKDGVQQTYRPQFRAIYFKVDQSLRTYCRNKETQEDVDVVMEYSQTDGAFNNEFFVTNAKASIQKLLGVATDTFIGNTMNIDV
ncbi:hypothetical protein V8F33_003551 [Rhypophila sp. PSN 637]